MKNTKIISLIHTPLLLLSLSFTFVLVTQIFCNKAFALQGPIDQTASIPKICTNLKTNNNTDLGICFYLLSGQPVNDQFLPFYFIKDTWDNIPSAVSKFLY